MDNSNAITVEKIFLGGGGFFDFLSNESVDFRYFDEKQNKIEFLFFPSVGKQAYNQEITSW